MASIRCSCLAKYLTLGILVFSLQSHAELMTSHRSSSDINPDKSSRFNRELESITPWTSAHRPDQNWSILRTQANLTFDAPLGHYYQVTFQLSDRRFNGQPIRRITKATGSGPMINRFDRALNSMINHASPSWKIQNTAFIPSTTPASVEMLDRQALLGTYKPTLDNVAVHLAPRLMPRLPREPTATITGLSQTATIKTR